MVKLNQPQRLSLDNKLKGHLLLRQAGLDSNTRNMIVGAASGNYAIEKISAAMRQAFRNTKNSSHGTTSTSRGGRNRGRGNRFGRGRGGNRDRNGRENQIGNDYNNRSATQNHEPIFYSGPRNFNSQKIPGAIIDSGACSSIVGQKTLDMAMEQIGLRSVDDARPKFSSHRFGDFEESVNTVCAILFPFEFTTKRGDKINFKIHFDVVPGHLPFLVGWPSLKSTKANLNCEYLNLGIKIINRYHKIPLKEDHHHVYLPFNSMKSSYYKPVSYPGYNPSRNEYQTGCASMGTISGGRYTPGSKIHEADSQFAVYK